MNAVEQKTSQSEAQKDQFENLLPLHYNFEFDGLPFDCNITDDENDHSITVSLIAKLGYLPYSAENKERRVQLLKLFGPLIAQGKINLDRHCNLTFSAETTSKNELCSKKIMETIVYTLLDVREIVYQVSSALKAH